MQTFYRSQFQSTFADKVQFKEVNKENHRWETSYDVRHATESTYYCLFSGEKGRVASRYMGIDELGLISAREEREIEINTITRMNQLILYLKTKNGK